MANSDIAKSAVKTSPIVRNKIVLSHENKLSLPMGKLVPVQVIHTLPGDVFKLSTEAFVRLAPMLAPVMHRCNVSIHHFFVPYRILYGDQHWEDYICDNGKYMVPWMYADDFIKVAQQCLAIDTYYEGNPSNLVGQLVDYLGIPVYNFAEGTLASGFYHKTIINFHKFLAYAKIYNDYYRDENLIEDIFAMPGYQKFLDYSGNISYANIFDGHDSKYDPEVTEFVKALFKLRNRAWQKDYFTTCFTTPQKGTAGSVNVEFPTSLYATSASSDGFELHGPLDIGTSGQPSGSAVLPLQGSEVRQGHYIMGVGPDTEGLAQSLVASQAGLSNLNLADVTASPASFTIEDLRLAEKLQELEELKLRAGTRYFELLKAQWNVVPEDSRLQRPEFIGGSSQPIVFSEVLQTSQTTDNSALGDYGGHGVSAQNGHFVKKYCPEHGMILSIMSIMPNATYQDGISRFDSKIDPLDMFQPQFETLGEQAVRQEELLALRYANNNPEATFGYQARYAEYKVLPNEVHGDFRGSLNYWHLGRSFANINGSSISVTPPALNQDFIEVEEYNDGLTRIFAVPGTKALPVQHFYAYLYHKVLSVRSMHKFVAPQLC